MQSAAWQHASFVPGVNTTLDRIKIIAPNGQGSSLGRGKVMSEALCQGDTSAPSLIQGAF
jgi:hypothetical protein